VSGADWLAVAVVGGLLGLDAVAFPQVMVARPLVAATVGGALAGAPAAGAWVGAWLELLSLRQLPVGAARYADTGPAALAAGLAYAAAGGGLPELVWAVAVGSVAGWLGGHTVQWQRGLNGRLVAPLADRPTPPATLVRRHLAAMALDFVRGAALACAWTAAARAAVDTAARGGGEALVRAALVLAAGAATAAGLRALARGSEAWRPFAAGGAVAVAWLAIAGLRG
jgi:mannose/fructose/N-acetylgalactosamine-specific phosphotransferase system component IIC